MENICLTTQQEHAELLLSRVAWDNTIVPNISMCNNVSPLIPSPWDLSPSLGPVPKVGSRFPKQKLDHFTSLKGMWCDPGHAAPFFWMRLTLSRDQSWPQISQMLANCCLFSQSKMHLTVCIDEQNPRFKRGLTVVSFYATIPITTSGWILGIA